MVVKFGGGLFLTRSQFKFLLGFIIFFGVVGVFSYVGLSYFEKSKKSFDGFLLVDGSEYWQYSNDSWKETNNIEEIDWHKFHVFSQNVYINDYYLSFYNNKYYFFDVDKNSYKVERPFLASSVESNISVVNYIDSSVSDDDMNIIGTYLSTNNILYHGNYSVLKKYVVDLDGKSTDDYVYVISNQLYSDEDAFYIVFAYYDDKIVTIDKQTGGDSFYDYDLAWVINVKSNGIHDIILKKYYKDNYVYSLYQYSKKNGYIRLFSN